MKKRSKDYFNCYTYLKQFWPKDPKATDVWKENKWLLERYTECVKILQKMYPDRKFNLMDISTGPTLAPNIIFSKLANNVQLTDYSLSNRRILAELGISYWKGYVKEILGIEGEPVSQKKINTRLSLLNNIRSKNPVLRVNIMNKHFINKGVDIHSFDLFTMHFVADSISSTRKEYYALLKNVLDNTKSGDILVMSALVECTKWDDGIKTFRSPDLKVGQIIAFMRKNGFEPLYKEKIIHEKAIGINGGMAVLMFKKS